MTRNEVNINTFTVIYSSGSQSTLRNGILNLWGLEPTDPNRARNQAVSLWFFQLHSPHSKALKKWTTFEFSTVLHRCFVVWWFVCSGFCYCFQVYCLWSLSWFELGTFICLTLLFSFFNFLLCTGVINSVVIVPSGQQRDSAIHTPVCIHTHMYIPTHMCPFSPQFPCHPGCHVTLGRVPCAG